MSLKIQLIERKIFPRTTKTESERSFFVSSKRVIGTVWWERIHKFRRCKKEFFNVVIKSWLWPSIKEMDFAWSEIVHDCVCFRLLLILQICWCECHVKTIVHRLCNVIIWRMLNGRAFSHKSTCLNRKSALNTVRFFATLSFEDYAICAQSGVSFGQMLFKGTNFTKKSFNPCS